MTPRTLLIALVGASCGLALGVGAYTFLYAKGGSYLVDDPAACANCHVMQPQYDGWMKSGHRHVASCNDCHTPHAFIPKYLVKAENGFWHSFYFTTGGHPDVIRARESSRRVTEARCRRCHEELTEAIHGHGLLTGPEQRLSCIQCHREVGHPR